MCSLIVMYSTHAYQIDDKYLYLVVGEFSKIFEETEKWKIMIFSFFFIFHIIVFFIFILYYI